MSIEIVKKIIALFGTEKAVASVCGTSQQNVNRWKKTGRITPSCVVTLEVKLAELGSDINRHVIRPDIFGEGEIDKAA